MWRVTVGANNIFDLYPDKNFKTQTAANPLIAGGYGTPGTIDLSNNNQFEFSRMYPSLDLTEDLFLQG